MSRKFVVTLALILLPFARSAHAFQWPEIKAVEKDFTIGDVGESYLHFEIQGKDGKPLYQFECATPGAYNNRDLEFDYTGDFECRLWNAEDTRYPTLLLDDPNESDAWNSRGRFFAYELFGLCGEYPEFGRIRHFRFRGMAITMTLDAVRLVRGAVNDRGRRLRLSSFHFHISIRPDSKAVSTIAGGESVRRPLFPDEPERADPSVLVRACGNVRRDLGRQPTQVTAKPVHYTTIVPTSAALPIGPEQPQLVVIRESTGRPAYRLMCGSDLDGFGEHLIAIKCSLYQAGASKFDLLASSLDPYSLQRRSRMVLDQVKLCSEYPEWGRTRVFELRGMRLVLRLNEPSTSNDLKGAPFAVLTVKIVPDEQAESPHAKPSKYIDPAFLPLDRADACKPLQVSF